MQKDRLYLNQAGDIITLGNNKLELGFDSRRQGALVSLIDKQTGYQFRRDPQAPVALFRLALRRAGDRELEWFDSRSATTFEWTRKTAKDGLRVVLEVGGFAGQAFTVSIAVTLRAGSPLSIWHLRVDGLQPDQAVFQVTCPIVSGALQVGVPVPGETLAVPRQSEGYLFRNPYPTADRHPLCAGPGPEAPMSGIGEIHGRYPGTFPVQFMLYYNDLTGLYCACHDAGQNVKTLDIGPLADWGTYPAMSISHLPSEAMGQAAAFEYDTVIGVFHGNWYDGADIYKEWAHRQWWCKKKLWDRDIAPWMRKGVGVWQMSNYHLPVLKKNHGLDQIAETVNSLSHDIGVPLLALIFNFEGGGAWTGPVGFFPPREGEEAFKAAMAKLRAAGNFGFVYMPGGNWYIAIHSYTPPFNSWPEFEARGRALAILNEKGEISVGRWYGGWEATWLCPQTQGVKEMTESMLLGSVERGCPVVQIDNFPCGGAGACYSKDHGHPLGYGPWWSEAWNRILSETRHKARKLDPNCAISTEGISENFIPHLDLYDQRAANMEYFGHYAAGDPIGGETIPLFGYVYSGYIGAYLAAMPECNRPEVLYWTRCLGKALAQGVIPSSGRYFPEPKESNPVTLAFYKKVVRAAAQECWPYIMFGEMLHAPVIKVPTITASYFKWTTDIDHIDPHQRHEVRDAAVQHSVWRKRDGTVAYFFINVSEKPVAFEVELSGHTSRKVVYDAESLVDGKRKTLFQRKKLPCRHRLRMAPLSVLVVEIRRHSRSSSL